jgi:hypothetical protein
MIEDEKDMTRFEVGGYIALLKGHEYTISGRGVVIGRLERVGDTWFAVRAAGPFERSADPVCLGADPKQVLREFLRREGHLTAE